MIAIVLGLLAFLGSVIQIMLMLVRGGMLVLLVGTLPLIAAFSNTEMGHQWFRKATAWLLAFALYKPAAAIIYAVAFKLGGQQGALALLDGVMMLFLAILALPALLRFLVPATSALASGGGAGVMLAGAAGAAAMRMPSGAAAIHSTSSSYQHQAASHGATGAASAVDFSAGAVTGSPGLVAASGAGGRAGASAPSAHPGQGFTPRAPGASGAGTAGAASGIGAAAHGAEQVAKGATAAHHAAGSAVSGDEKPPSSRSGTEPSGSEGTPS